MARQTNISKSCVRDSEFFKVEKPLFIQVENVLFCVPPHYFDSSDVFRSMFSLPSTPDDSPQDGTSECPLFLEGIQADHFRDLLRILSFSIATLSASENLHRHIRERPTSWVAVLDLATRWEMASVRSWALKCLKNEDCLTRLVLARKYDILEWRVPAIKELAVRASPLTPEEFHKLGVDLALRVVALRERVRSSTVREPTLEDINEIAAL
ncbi:hypothetical protein L227DRAFT_651306 [Lentinus tigrinus ALCF2SS1-6]|uniref:BTB domain-containing protein n=1 Tax=Lentinus tigrinus ALCF2SS1-6 TaxID=1328759 RepID=A0A5C2SH70_9APHY|nr:hypothetical protein L227DRAFT_651306 [Lentinus tigrinus ALCF2SS1-6]